MLALGTSFLGFGSYTHDHDKTMGDDHHMDDAHHKETGSEACEPQCFFTLSLDPSLIMMNDALGGEDAVRMWAGAPQPPRVFGPAFRIACDSPGALRFSSDPIPRLFPPRCPVLVNAPHAMCVFPGPPLGNGFLFHVPAVHVTISYGAQ